MAEPRLDIYAMAGFRVVSANSSGLFWYLVAQCEGPSATRAPTGAPNCLSPFMAKEFMPGRYAVERIPYEMGAKRMDEYSAARFEVISANGTGIFWYVLARCSL